MSSEERLLSGNQTTQDVAQKEKEKLSEKQSFVLKRKIKKIIISLRKPFHLQMTAFWRRNALFVVVTVVTMDTRREKGVRPKDMTNWN